jgi:hypothetical protein
VPNAFLFGTELHLPDPDFCWLKHREHLERRDVALSSNPLSPDLRQVT